MPSEENIADLYSKALVRVKMNKLFSAQNAELY